MPVITHIKSFANPKIDVITPLSNPATVQELRRINRRVLTQAK